MILPRDTEHALDQEFDNARAFFRYDALAAHRNGYQPLTEKPLDELLGQIEVMAGNVRYAEDPGRQLQSLAFWVFAALLAVDRADTVDVSSGAAA